MAEEHDHQNLEADLEVEGVDTADDGDAQAVSSLEHRCGGAWGVQARRRDRGARRGLRTRGHQSFWAALAASAGACTPASAGLWPSREHGLNQKKDATRHNCMDKRDEQTRCRTVKGTAATCQGTGLKMAGSNWAATAAASALRTLLACLTACPSAARGSTLGQLP